MRDFDNKTVVVTGGASGIGLALAERFAAAGMRVVLADIEASSLEAALKTLQAQGAEAIGVEVNVMQRDSVMQLAERAMDAFGNIHVLCNNAGVSTTVGASSAIGDLCVWEMPEADWDWVMGVNFAGARYGLQAFVPHMIGHGETGHIVNTASLAAFIPGGGPYGASKHALLSLTETLYLDLKAQKSAIGASLLCPGFVNTHLHRSERNRPAEVGRPAGLPETDSKMAMAGAIMASGDPPSAMAEAVFQGIQGECFYILPHPQWDAQVQARIDHVLQRKRPLDIENVEGVTDQLQREVS